MCCDYDVINACAKCYGDMVLQLLVLLSFENTIAM